MSKSKKPIILTDEQIKYINTLLSIYRAVTTKAMKGISMAAGVKANCLNCCNWDRSITVDCGIPDCPLFQYNPYRKRRLKSKKAKNARTE